LIICTDLQTVKLLVLCARLCDAERCDWYLFRSKRWMWMSISHMLTTLITSILLTRWTLIAVCWTLMFISLSCSDTAFLLYNCFQKTASLVCIFFSSLYLHIFRHIWTNWCYVWVSFVVFVWWICCLSLHIFISFVKYLGAVISFYFETIFYAWIFEGRSFFWNRIYCHLLYIYML